MKGKIMLVNKLFSFVVLSAASCLLCSPKQGRAKEILREPFDSISSSAASALVGGQEGNAWTQASLPPEVRLYVERDLSPGSAGKGAISFDLVKNSNSGDKEGSIFSLQDSGGNNVVTAQISWEKHGSQGPIFSFYGNRYFYYEGMGLWKPVVPLKTKFKDNESYHFDLVWNDSIGEYELYVDGKAQDAKNQLVDSASGKADPRIRINEIDKKYGDPIRFFDKPFSNLLSKTRGIVLGADYEKSRGAVLSPLVDAAMDNFVVVVDEDVRLVKRVEGENFDVRDLAGSYVDGDVALSWAPPKTRGVNQGYKVYRRAGQGNARFELLTTGKIYDLKYVDKTVSEGETYRYSVTVDYNGIESKYPPEIAITAADISISSLAVDRTVYAGGQEIAATMRGARDGSACFSVSSIADCVPMAEIDHGVYVGAFTAPEGIDQTAQISGSLSFAEKQNSAAVQGPAIIIDSTPPEPVLNIIATPDVGAISIGWTASASVDCTGYEVYRAQGANPATSAEPYEFVRSLEFIDAGVIAGIEYRYLVVPVDHAGNKGAPSDIVSEFGLKGDGPSIANISVEPFGKPLKPGETATITVAGQGDGQVSASVGSLVADLPLQEVGRTGKYVGSFVVLDEHIQTDENANHLVTVKLCDAFGCSEQGGPNLIIVGTNALNDKTPPIITSANNNGFQAAGFSGSLVPGDELKVTATGEAQCFASFDIDGISKSSAMEETSPGVYEGVYTVGWSDQGEDSKVYVRLTDAAGNETVAEAGKPVAFDSRVRLLVSADDSMLSADSKSKTRVTVRAENANGDPASGHELQLALHTTDEYTGVVGGGRINDKQALPDDEDDIEVKWGGTTDAFGEVSATYTAGFAAKTALVIAKDLSTGDVGAGWLNTYIASTVSIELFPRTARDQQDLAILKITATPQKLTADGRSRSRIKAMLTDLSGKPLSSEKISFSMAGTNGSLRVLGGGRTDSDGIAEAEYRAGTLMGTVTITASKAELGVTAAVKIVLMSDAPAKIDLAASAVKLPADGNSIADLNALVSDINDNPNQDAPVAFAILKGSGKLSTDSVRTDRNGEAQVVYTAGRSAGVVEIEARHTSRSPTKEELRRVYGSIFVPRLSERQERDRIKIKKWLIEPGDEVEKGQEIVILESRKGSWTLASKEKGIFAGMVRHKRDVVELGDILGYVEINEDVWTEKYEQPF